MKLFSRVISASLSPNTEPDDVGRALAILLNPLKWKTGRSQESVAAWFSGNFKGSEVEFFNSGRAALLCLLQSFGIGKGDEVIVQAFTCVAVPNSVLWAGAVPVYADINADYNLDPVDVASKITSRTKAIIVQHTFGIPADMNSIMAVAKKHNLVVIEDCAHGLGAHIDGALLGSVGDAAFFSFGRDKPLSSVWGGAAIVRAHHKKEAAKLRKSHASLPMPGFLWIGQQLMHPIAFSVILPLYNSGLGKLLLFILLKMKLLSVPVFSEEKSAGRPSIFPARYPNALAYLLVGQLRKLSRYTKARQQIASRYADTFRKFGSVNAPAIIPGASYLRYSISVDHPQRVRTKAKELGILLGNWYNNIIDPTGVSFAAIGYIKGSCKTAERLSETAINLPTRISSAEADKVISFFRSLH